MSRIPVLCKPLSEIGTGYSKIDEVETCYNCGSHLFYPIQEFGLVKRDDVENVEVVNVDLFCAVCGMEMGGYSLVEEEDIIKRFDDKDDAGYYQIASWVKQDIERAEKEKKVKK